MTRILHTSDLHGNYQLLIEVMDAIDFDIWVDSGDFFPNSTRGDSHIENHFQNDWLILKSLPEKLHDLLRGRPAVLVPGNHDYIDLSSRLKKEGCVAFNLCHNTATIDKFRFSGFREIPYIKGEWAGEIYNQDFDRIIKDVIFKNPNVLVTHAPPFGILSMDSNGIEQGIKSLTNMVQWNLESLEAHLFGHIHASGGKKIMLGNTIFSNAATYYNIVEI